MSGRKHFANASISSLGMWDLRMILATLLTYLLLTRYKIIHRQVAVSQTLTIILIISFFSDSFLLVSVLNRLGKQFYTSNGSMSNFLHINITESNEAPPTLLERRVIRELYGISASIENCLRLVYLSSIIFLSFSSLFILIFPRGSLQHPFSLLPKFDLLHTPNR